jgi:hypothetical protein
MTKTAILLALGALALPVGASAKEPTAATIEGPGLDGPITIRGSADDNDGSPLARMVVAGAVPAAMFGHRIPDPMKRTRPKGALGPRYSVTYTVLGPDGRNYSLHQDVYPYASPRPLTYMKPDVPFFPGFTTHGGWFVGGPKLKRALIDAGLPSQAPSGGDSAIPVDGVVAGVAVLLAVGLALGLRRKTPPATA